MSFQHAEFATEPAVIQPAGHINQAEFASMISGEEPLTALKSNLSAPEASPNADPASAVVTPVAEKPLEKPLHYDLKLPQPVIYKPLLFSKKVKRVKRSSQKGKNKK